MRDGQTILVPHFNCILNACTKQKLFPDCIIKADLSPIYNTADPVYVTNYRPISITSAFSEYFERFLHQEITIQKFEHRNPLQVVFPKLVSTADALLFFIESVCKSIDSNNIVQTALWDPLKAFDSKSDDILIETQKKLDLIAMHRTLRKVFCLTHFNL